MKQKNGKQRVVLAVIISVILFGVTEPAAAADPALSEALYGHPPSGLMHKQQEPAFSQAPDFIRGAADEKKEITEDPLPEEAVMVLPGDWRQMEWMRVKMIHPQPLSEPMDLYRRIGAGRPIFGLGWDRDAGKLNKWNVVFGLGIYVSAYQDGYRQAEDFGLVAPVSDREQMDLFEKIQSALQAIGFQIRYDF